MWRRSLYILIKIIFLQCSKTCGGGIQRRTAKCIDDRNTPIDDSYCNNSEMITEQICNTENCPVWTLADTSSVRKKKHYYYFYLQLRNRELQIF